MRARGDWWVLGVLAVVFCATWEYCARRGMLQGRWPTLESVGAAAYTRRVELLRAARGTLADVLEATLYGSLLGLLLGGLLSAARSKLKSVAAMVSGLKAIPVTVLIPIFLSVFGLERFLVPLIALPMAINVGINLSKAIGNVSEARYRLLRSWSVPRHVYCRSVLPFECMEAMLQTTRVVLPLVFALHIALDYFLGVSGGLGSFVRMANDRYQYGAMYAAIAFVGCAGIALEWFLGAIESWGLRWKRDI